MTDFEQVEDYLAMAAGEVLDPKVEQAIQDGISEITGKPPKAPTGSLTRETSTFAVELRPT